MSSPDLPGPLRDEIRLLGGLLGQVITEQAGAATFQLVESLRQAAVTHRRDGADRAVIERIVAGLDVDQAGLVARAFTVFFQLANIAEQRGRVRILRDRDRAAATRRSPTRSPQPWPSWAAIGRGSCSWTWRSRRCGPRTRRRRAAGPWSMRCAASRRS